MKNSVILSLVAVLVVLQPGCATQRAVSPSSAEPVQTANWEIASIAEETPESRATAAILAAELAGRRGEAARAARYTLEAASITQDARLAQRATKLAFAAEDDQLASEAAVLWLDLQPDDHEARSLALRARVATGEATVDELEAWLENSGDVERAEQQLAGMLGLASPDSERALALLAELEQRRQTAALAYGYAVLALRYEQVEPALAALDRAQSRGWDSRACDEMRLRAFVATQQLSKAAITASNLREQMADDRPAALAVGQYLLDSQAWGLARQQFAFVAEQWPDDAAAQMALGLLEAQSGNTKQAATHFEALWNLGVRKDEAAWQLGRLAGTAQDWATAEKWFSRVVEGARYVDAQLALAQVLAEQGRVVEARSHLLSLREANAEAEARSWRGEAEILHKSKQTDEALRVLENGIAATQSLDLYYFRALIHEENNDFSAAEADLSEILKRDPDNAQAMNALGYMLADHNRDLERARELVDQALALRPGDPAIRDSLGWVLYRSGNLEAAKNELTAAYASFPDAEIAAHLGEVLWVLGQRDAANEIWRQALNRAPTNPTLLNTWRKFTQP